MPRLLATKLASVHGGHPNNYPVLEASITPYIVTCTNSRVRDTIVQGGIYSIPHRRIRFTVHEWRPRFGLGHDPTTHQVWVRIVGLPLQAWTAKGITTFLQKFGHPIDILPYGREAGHYRDITALVNTGHPTRIPLAYKYREGDFSTLVEVIILRSRQWAPGYYPPPDDQESQQIALPSRQQGPNYGGSQGTHTQNSSSSDGAPSEPTLDLSCWSPRSYKILPLSTTTGKRNPKGKQSQENFTKGDEVELTLPFRQMLECSLLLAGDAIGNVTIPIQAPLRGYRWDAATLNRIAIKDPHGAHASIRVSTLLPNPCHIAENLLRLLATPLSDNKTLSELSFNSLPRACCTTLTPRKRGLMAPTPDLTLLRGRNDRSLSIMSVPLPLNPIEEGPPRPNTHSLSSTWFGPSTAPSKLPLRHTEHWPVPGYASSPLLSHHTQIAHSQQSASEDEYPSLSVNGLPPNFPNNFALSDAVDPISQQPHVTKIHSAPGTHSLSSHRLNTGPKAQEPNTVAHCPQTTKTQLSHDLCSRIYKAKNKKKGNQMATRRSPRLQAKQTGSHSMAKSSEKNKSLTIKLPFDFDDTETPIDADNALTILQASGLQITEQVHELIAEAVRQDKQDEIQEEMAPTTPLHDHIPPLAVPGADFLL